jgi:site-specific DNA-methyltransferase (adenine-specific)
MKDYDHPAMFPQELPRRLIKLLSYKNDIVLDPFNGVGTTTLVAWKHRRRFIGIDISQQYCDMALRRVIASAGANDISPEYPLPAFLEADGLTTPD